MLKDDIDNLRKSMGTLPSQKPQKNYEYKNSLETCYVNLTSFPQNYAKSIVIAATSTWGNGQCGPNDGCCNKWNKLTPQNRYRVVLAALTGNTLPLALENISFQFEINGVPRHTFDQWARTRLATHQSIGCRDNSKIDAPFILYSELYEEIESSESLKKDFVEWVIKTKDLYEKILNTGRGSYQMARAVLPMSYNHSFTTYINFASLQTQCNRRMMACEEGPIVLMSWKMRSEIKNKVSPFLANYLRPLCDKVKKCVYHGGAEGLTKYFSNLFAGCGRWEDEVDYAEFNFSCTSYEKLKNYVEIVEPNEWIDFSENDYEKLSDIDKKIFEED
ncbi:MAG TPA: FAD-dependent thymidylate synthase [Bacteroidota bacterium]|nr:FAD-dependent thymidylate synthase [Bacteroidota bacterium]